MADAVKASWWHRLLLVLIALVLLLISAIALYVAYDSSKSSAEFYSWRNGGIPNDEYSTECRVQLYAGVGGVVLGCGKFETPTELIDDLVASKVFSSAMVPSPRSTETDGHYAATLVRPYGLRHAYGRVFDWGKAPKAFGIAIGVILLAWLVLTLGFNVILWIAHGTTRIGA